MIGKPGLFVFVVVVLVHVAGAAAAQTFPAPFEADYEGSRFPLTAKATIALSRAGDFYKYTLRGSVYLGFYKVTEIYDCGVMRARDNILRPVEYVHRDSRKRRRNLHTRFDWTNGTARTTAGDGSVREIDGLRHLAWDPMSIQVRMRMDVAGAKPGDTFEYAVLHKGEMRHHRAEIEGTETIDTGAHRLKATKVRVEGPKRANKFWFAANYAWLPVRITLNDVTLQLASPPEEAGRRADAPADRAPQC